MQCKKAKLQSCRQRPVFPRRSRSVLGKLWFFWLLMWHFMNSARSVKFDAGHHAVVVLLGLGAILVLPLARMPLLKLYCQRATSVPSCVCYLAHLCPHLYSKRQLQKNHNFDTSARVEIARWLHNTCRCISSRAMKRFDHKRKLFSNDAA